MYCDLFSSNAKYVDDVFIWPFLSHTVTRHWFIPFRLVQISWFVNLVVTRWGDSKVCGQGEKVQRFPGREIIVMWKSNDGVSLSETASQGSIPIVSEWIVSILSFHRFIRVRPQFHPVQIKKKTFLRKACYFIVLKKTT